ncbi:MAG: radical SAM protein, partial [Desulfobacteraceae bacterium]
LGLFALNRITMRFLPLSKLQKTLLDLGDGKRTIAEIVSEIGKGSSGSKDRVYKELDFLYREKYIFLANGRGAGGAAAEMVRKLGSKMDRFGRAGDLLWLSAGERTGMAYLHAPMALTLILTMRCNANCAICFVKPHGDRKYISIEMDTPDILKLLDQAAELGVDRIRLFGGEALLRKDIAEILDHGRRLNLGLALYTNGIAISHEEKANDLAALMQGYPYFYVQVSLDGMGAAHDSQRPGAGVDTVKQAIQNLQNGGIPFATNTVLNKKNVSEIETITAFAHEQGAENIIFNTIKLCGGGSGLEDIRLSPAEVHALQKRFDRLKKLYPDQEIYPNLQETFERAQLLETAGLYPKKMTLGGSGLAHNCLAFTYSMAVAPDGSVLPCEFFAPFTEYWGESLLTRGLKWAWDESMTSRFMRHLPVKGKCDRCEHRESCDMGCPVENRMVTGSFEASNPFCWYEPGCFESAGTFPENFDYIRLQPEPHRDADS